MNTDADARIDAILQMLLDLTDALLRQGTERDGNWGHEPSLTTIARINEAISLHQKARST